MPMLMPALSGICVAGNGLPVRLREGGARVGEGVDADAEPGDAVAARDADQAEEQDDRDLDRRKAVHDGARRVHGGGEPPK